MFAKLQRLNTTKSSVRVTVELVSLRFVKKDSFPLDSNIVIVYEKMGKKRASSAQPVQYSSDAAFVTFTESLVFSSTLFMQNGKCMRKSVDLIIRRIDGKKEIDLGKCVIHLHDMSESIPFRCRLNVEKGGSQIGAALDVVLTLTSSCDGEDNSSVISDLSYTIDPGLDSIISSTQCNSENSPNFKLEPSVSLAQASSQSPKSRRSSVLTQQASSSGGHLRFQDNFGMKRRDPVDDAIVVPPEDSSALDDNAPIIDRYRHEISILTMKLERRDADIASARILYDNALRDIEVLRGQVEESKVKARLETEARYKQEITILKSALAKRSDITPRDVRSHSPVEHLTIVSNASWDISPEISPRLPEVVASGSGLKHDPKLRRKASGFMSDSDSSDEDNAAFAALERTPRSDGKISDDSTERYVHSLQVQLKLQGTELATLTSRLGESNSKCSSLGTKLAICEGNVKLLEAECEKRKERIDALERKVEELVDQNSSLRDTIISHNDRDKDIRTRLSPRASITNTMTGWILNSSTTRESVRPDVNVELFNRFVGTVNDFALAVESAIAISIDIWPSAVEAFRQLKYELAPSIGTIKAIDVHNAADERTVEQQNAISNEVSRFLSTAQKYISLINELSKQIIERVDSLEKETEAIRKEHDSRVEDSQADVANSEVETKTLTQALAMSKLDLAISLQDNEDLQRMYRKLEKDMCGQKLQLADLQAQLDDKNEEIRALKAAVSAFAQLKKAVKK